MSNFIDTIVQWFQNLGNLIAEGFGKLFDFLAKPFTYLFWFLDGVFYFFTVLFEIVVKVIMIFVALFQFIGALFIGFFKTLQEFLTPSFGSVNLPSTSGQGFNVVMDIVDPIGVLSIVPYILLALVWFAFIMKIFALFGGEVVAKGGN